MNDSVINDLIQKCWFGSTGTPIEATDLDGLTNHDELYIASIIFTGTSEGSLTVIMSEALAKAISAATFDSPLDAVTYDDVHDCIGELANVIAGNLKTEIFGNSELSKPLVMQGNDSILATFQIDAIFQKVYVNPDKEQIIIQICQTGG